MRTIPQTLEVVSYKDDATAATKKYPRSLADGAWGGGETPKPDPTPGELAGSVSIRGNAIVGQHFMQMMVSPIIPEHCLIGGWQTVNFRCKQCILSVEKD